MKKKTLALIMAAAMVMGLTACGSAADTTTETTETTETAEETTEAADDAAAAEETAETTEESTDTASSDKVWVVATDTAFKPFEYTDDKGCLLYTSRCV